MKYGAVGGTNLLITHTFHTFVCWLLYHVHQDGEREGDTGRTRELVTELFRQCLEPPLVQGDLQHITRHRTAIRQLNTPHLYTYL